MLRDHFALDQYARPYLNLGPAPKAALERRLGQRCKTLARRTYQCGHLVLHVRPVRPLISPLFALLNLS